MGGLRTVLVIDDDAGVRDALAACLEADGLRVWTAPSGPRGLELARAEAPQVVIVDLLMPAMNGLQVIQALRGDAGTAAARVILMTGAGPGVAGAAVAAGAADAVLPKPFELEELLAAVRRLAP